VERLATPMRGPLAAVPAVTALPGALVVRSLHLEDASELGHLMFAAYRGTVDDHGETDAWHLQEAAGTLKGDFGRVLWAASLVATERNRLVATCLVTEENGLPLLAFALALPEYQGRGLGTALITRSAARLRTAGYHEWSLAVTEGSPAVGLYQRMGFVTDESLRHGRGGNHPEAGTARTN
jgi:GNAT superfamily N-acetyltransferase